MELNRLPSLPLEVQVCLLVFTSVVLYMLYMSGSISFGANPWNGFISLRGIRGIYIIERNPWNLYHREESMESLS